MNIKKSLLFLLLLTVFFLSGCALTKNLSGKTLIQEEEVTISNKYKISAYITNSISDPEYARLFINNVEIFRCRGATQISFSIQDNVLTIYTNGNLNYEYDRKQKTSYKELLIEYVEMQ